MKKEMKKLEKIRSKRNKQMEKLSPEQLEEFIKQTISEGEQIANELEMKKD